MGAIKTADYTIDELRNSELGRAIGAPARIIILRFLKENNRVSGPTLKKILKLNQSTIQQHVSTLVDTGLICGNFVSNVYAWSLNPDTSKDFEKIKWALNNPSD